MMLHLLKYHFLSMSSNIVRCMLLLTSLYLFL